MGLTGTAYDRERRQMTLQVTEWHSYIPRDRLNIEPLGNQLID